MARITYQDYLAGLGGERYRIEDSGNVDTAMSEAAWNALTPEQQAQAFGLAGGVIGNLRGTVMGGDSEIVRRNGYTDGSTPYTVTAERPTQGIINPDLVKQDPESGLWIVPISAYDPAWREEQESAGGIFGGDMLRAFLMSAAAVGGLGALANGGFLGSLGAGAEAGAGAGAAAGGATPLAEIPGLLPNLEPMAFNFPEMISAESVLADMGLGAVPTVEIPGLLDPIVSTPTNMMQVAPTILPEVGGTSFLSSLMGAAPSIARALPGLASALTGGAGGSGSGSRAAAAGGGGFGGAGGGGPGRGARVDLEQNPWLKAKPGGSSVLDLMTYAGGKR